MKRYIWDSDERGHYIYVLQIREPDDDWRDVPVVNEDEQGADYV